MYPELGYTQGGLVYNILPFFNIVSYSNIRPYAIPMSRTLENETLVRTVGIKL